MLVRKAVETGRLAALTAHAVRQDRCSVTVTAGGYQATVPVGLAKRELERRGYVCGVQEAVCQGRLYSTPYDETDGQFIGEIWDLGRRSLPQQGGPGNPKDGGPAPRGALENNGEERGTRRISQAEWPDYRANRYAKEEEDGE